MRRTILLVAVACIAAAGAEDIDEDDWPWQDLSTPQDGAPGGQFQLPITSTGGPAFKKEAPSNILDKQRQQQQQQQEKAPPGNMFERIIAYLKQNPFMAAMLAYYIMKRFKGKAPWPEVGGNITKVHNTAEWEELVKDCKAAKRVLVADGYALWCGPCKSCAESYARLSEELSTASCTLSKFDVDEASDVAKLLKVSSMPCFVVYKEGKEVDRKMGFPGKDGLKQLLMKHGALESADNDDSEPRIVDVTEDSDKYK